MLAARKRYEKRIKCKSVKDPQNSSWCTVIVFPVLNSNPNVRVPQEELYKLY